ncbi:unnamed protein product [Vitrella brassicaformis CCMP3155]|uniref:Uncharacterized protein n=1 Tax=Vitrella brassicaformis (strain CCMP3155) TaxID=1169540 RepID=A0A0G4G0L4_VITBC|nr:unnamed protein product [Vitrella brassicaformis CCMP3155]|eukprot:CEM21311.1 unnamed protein product [Vitrella brassicaformis CCMP3155]
MLFGAFRAAAASTLFHGGQSDCPLFPLDMPANLEGESPLWSLQDPEQPRPFGLNVLMPLFDTEEHTSHCSRRKAERHFGEATGHRVALVG